jgi:tetratricopeptide (TPR) repeat protein
LPAFICVRNILNKNAAPAVLLAACIAFPAAALADCAGPPALTAQFRAHPTAETAVQLGSWFAGNGQFGCAIETFRAGLAADPQSAQLHYLDGLALAESNRTAEAIPELEAAARLQPEILKPHLLLASLYDQSHQFTQADDQWKEALGLDPHSELALESWSNSLFTRKDYPAVIRLLQPAPRIEPLTLILAKAYEALNNPDPAGAALNQALKLKPTSFPLADAEASLLIRLHKYDSALRLLNKAAQQHPENLQAQASLFRALVLTQHIDRARPMAPKLLAHFPHDAEILYLNGVVARAGGDDANARRFLEQAVALDPSFFSYRYTLGCVLINLHEWQQAREQLEAAIAAGDHDAEVHHQLAIALRGLGDEQAAARETTAFQQMREAEDDASMAALKASQADIDLSAGKIDEAVSLYREASALAPGNAQYKLKLADALRLDPSASKSRPGRLTQDPTARNTQP